MEAQAVLVLKSPAAVLFLKRVGDTASLSVALELFPHHLLQVVLIVSRFGHSCTQFASQIEVIAFTIEQRPDGSA
ncbi:hypothetical protein D3C78_1816320 [compost metagenome]